MPIAADLVQREAGKSMENQGTERKQRAAFVRRLMEKYYPGELKRILKENAKPGGGEEKEYGKNKNQRQKTKGKDRHPAKRGQV